MITNYDKYNELKLEFEKDQLYELLGLGKLWAGLKNYVKNIKGVADIDKIFKDTLVKIDAQITKLTGINKEILATTELDKETPASGTTVSNAGLNKQKYDSTIKQIDILIKQYDIATAAVAKKYNTSKTTDYVSLKRLELDKDILDKKDKMLDSLADETAKNTLKNEIKAKRLANEKQYKIQADKIKNESESKTELVKLEINQEYDYTNSSGNTIKVTLLETPDKLTDKDKLAENEKMTIDDEKWIKVKGKTSEFHVRWNHLKGGPKVEPKAEPVTTPTEPAK